MTNRIRTIGIVLAIVLLAWVAWFVYDNLRPRTEGEKLAEVIHTADRRELTSRLIDLSEDPSPLIRTRAALAFGRIAAERSAPLLMDMVTDSALEVAAAAAFAIGITGNRAYAEKILDVAWDLPAGVTVAAVKSAGRLADSSMTDVADGLVAFLQHPSPAVREAACYAIFYAGAKQLGDSLISLMKKEPDPDVKLAALFALSRLQIEKASPIFKEHLADADPWARMLAIRGLAKSALPDATQLLTMALNDKDNGVVAEAVVALSRRPDTSVVGLRLAQELRQESDEKLVVALLEALQRIQSDRAIAVTYEMLARQPGPNILAASLTYLAAVQGGRALAVIDSVLNGPQVPYVRAAGADAYALVGSPGVVSRLGVLFGDEDPMVRASAFAGLTKVDANNLDYYIDRAINDPDYVMEVLAIDKVKEHALTKYLPVMHTMITRGSEIDVDIRRAIMDALTTFIKPSDNDSAVMQILIAGILDPNYIVRREAADIYKNTLNEDRSNMVPPARTTITEGEVEDGFKKYEVNPSALILTDRGQIEMELYFDVAPLTVLNFIKLARSGFYDGLVFHRVVPNFVIQGGDPRGDGWGGPDYYIRDEYSSLPFVRGAVGIATSGKDTGGSQFFITLSPQPHLNARYTLFGQVVDGMDVVDSIVRGDVIQRIVIKEETK